MERTFTAIWRERPGGQSYSHVFTAENLFKAGKVIKRWEREYPECTHVDLIDGSRVVHFQLKAVQ